MLGIVKEFCNRGLFDDPAQIHHRHAYRQMFNNRKVSG